MEYNKLYNKNNLTFKQTKLYLLSHRLSTLSLGKSMHRFFNKKHAFYAMTENEKYLYDHFLISIKSGFESLEDVIDSAIEAVDDEGWEREISETWLREILTLEYEKHKQKSASWEAKTDPDKLAKVFDSLCRGSILALHNVGYTNSDAIYDTKEIWQELKDEGASLVGYCYYHGQDLERVITTGELCIGFSGERENNDKESIAIGNKVKEALENAGFVVEWNHTASGKIKIVDFEWKNSYTSDEEVEKIWGHDRVFELMKH